jgi:GDPmannose 4,6-dehydratase
LYVVNGILYNHESSKSKTLLGVTNNIIKHIVNIKKGIIPDYYVSNLKIHLDIGSAEDYIEAIWLTLQQAKPDNYIIATSTLNSIEYICQYTCSKLGLDYKQCIKTDIDSIELPKLKGDSFKLKSMGWNPKHIFDDTINKIINFYLNI